MTRTAILSSVLAAGLITSSQMVMAAGAPVVAGQQDASSVSVADAAPFLGEWTLTLQGPNGPGTFGLTVKAEGDKVVGEISNEMMPVQAISKISKVDKSLVLAYAFPWEGNSVDAVVTLTPGEEAKMTAQIDFASGAYVMSGTAAKKEKAK
jgi:hypothetical protein